MTVHASTPIVESPSFEHHPSGFGVGCGIGNASGSKPRLSWRFAHSDVQVRSWLQSAYDVHVVVSDAKGRVTKEEQYHVKSDESVLVPWPGSALASRESANVKIKCYGRCEGDDEVRATEWSVASVVETALLNKEDWEASFITSSASEADPPDKPLRPLRMRKTFSIPAGQNLNRARLYITALGVYDAYLNGERAGDHVLAPGWQTYKHRLHFQTFDVTSQLLKGENNVFAVEVAEGWYAGRLGFHGGKRFWYGKEMGLLAQLELYMTSGERFVVGTDESWKVGLSAIISSEIYDGELYNAREERAGWNSDVKFDDGSWVVAKCLTWPNVKLVAPDAPPVRVTEEVQPVEIFKTPAGKVVLDMGQNLVGYVRIKSLEGPAGLKVTLSHAEVMEKGELGTRPLRDAKCTDTIILSGETMKDWHAKFTFHGFRYVQIDGWPGSSMPSIDNFTALVFHSDMKRRGYFSCNNEMVNKLHQNVVWGLRGNSVSVFTDCPARDERLGWTGDIQAFTPSVLFLYSAEGMLSNWLDDLKAEHLEEERKGVPCVIVPDVLMTDFFPTVPCAIWDDVTILAPFDIYNLSGDSKILDHQLDSMKAWVDKGVARGPDGLWEPTSFQLGDWLDPAAPPNNPADSRTDNILVANAFLVHVTTTLAKACVVINRIADAERYKTEATNLRKLFSDKYITPAGNIMSNTQTAISLAVRFGLYSNPRQLATATASLALLVRKAGFHIATGFAGTPNICHALTAVGETQLAYRMLLEETCPSWLYPVTMGATTQWERWDSMLPDGSINPGEMTSFNHFALGSIVDWLHTTVGGISAMKPGWKVVKVCPIPGGTITEAEVSFDGPYGFIKCAWRIAGVLFNMELQIPPNSRAWVVLPGGKRGPSEGFWVGSGEYVFHNDYEAEEWPPKANSFFPEMQAS